MTESPSLSDRTSPSPCERCCKCGASIPFHQGVVLGVCTPCWNAVEHAPDDAPAGTERIAPPVGQSENLNILPGGYFARLLSGGNDD